MRAHRRARIGGHIGPHMRAQRTTHMRSQDWEAHVAQAFQSKATLGNLQEKCRAPIPGHLFCASLRSRNAHGHFTSAEEPFRVVIYKKNAPHYFCARHFACACAVETHIDISQEPFCVVIYKKNAAH